MIKMEVPFDHNIPPHEVFEFRRLYISNVTLFILVVMKIG